MCEVQRDIERHLEGVRTLEIPHESLLPARQPFLANVIESAPPLSPRQIPQDDSRRPSVADIPRPNVIRPHVPQHFAVTPRRYGSIGAANSSPNYGRPPIPPTTASQPQQLPHPLSTVSSPPGSSVGRRHTSADIRQHGWPAPGSSPFSSNVAGNPASHWPPSPPHRTPTSSDQQVQDVLARYEMGAPRRLQSNSRHATPPLSTDTAPPTFNVDNGWSFGGPKLIRHHDSLPATRRSSMASNVHSLLNPTERTEDDRATSEDRKRRRLD